MGTGSFPGVKRPVRGVNRPPPPNAEVKERVELYLYSPSGPSWPVIGRTSLLPLPMSLSLEVKRPVRDADHQCQVNKATHSSTRTFVALFTHPIFRVPAVLSGGTVAYLHPVQRCKIHFLTLQAQREVYLAAQRNKRVVQLAAVTLQYYSDPNVINLRAT
jgi:hypothetical protein